MEVKVLSIGQICKRFSSGKNITSQNISEEGVYPVYGGNGLRGYTDTYNFEGECAIVGRQGAYCGNVKYVRGKAYMSEHAIVAVTNSEHNNKYFYYKLSLAKLGRFSGQAAQPGLSVTKLLRLKLEMPSRKYQDVTASILSTYDTLIENNTKRIRLLEKMAENLYKEWFVRFRFPGHENVEMENGLPKGWKIIFINDCCETIGGGTPSTSKSEYWNGNVKWVTPTDLTNKSSMPLLNIAGRITDEGLAHSSAKLLPTYSILMTSRASIGYLGINLEPVCTNQGFISIIPQTPNLLMYFLYMLKNRRNEIISNANGATFLEISKGRFRKMKMVLPNKEMLDEFQVKAFNLFNMVLKLEKQNSLLARQRDLLLPRLMSGKLEVKVKA